MYFSCAKTLTDLASGCVKRFPDILSELRTRATMTNCTSDRGLDWSTLFQIRRGRKADPDRRIIPPAILPCFKKYCILEIIRNAAAKRIWNNGQFATVNAMLRIEAAVNNIFAAQQKSSQTFCSNAFTK